MTAQARIAALLPSLSVKERAILCLKAQNAGEETTELTRGMPKEQRHEFNKYMGLAFVCGCHFGVLVQVIQSQIEDLRFDLGRINMLGEAASILQEDDPASVAEHPVRDWRKQKQVTVPVFLRGLALEMRNDAFKELSLRWQELRAVELVTDEIAQSFDREDPLHPQVRQQLEACKVSAVEINAVLTAKPRRLPEPDDGHMGRTRELIDQGFRALGLVEE